jgi:hypothetical protein
MMSEFFFLKTGFMIKLIFANLKIELGKLKLRFMNKLVAGRKKRVLVSLKSHYHRRLIFLFVQSRIFFFTIFFVVRRNFLTHRIS